MHPSFLTLFAVIAVLGAIHAVSRKKWALVRSLTSIPSVVLGLALLLLVGGALAGFALFGDWNKPEYLGLTYEEYVARFQDPSFDPVGASNISYRLDTTRDSYDAWTKLDISPEAFGALVARMSAYVEESNARSSGIEGATKRLSPSPNLFPEGWPRPDTDLPAWWDPPNTKEMVRIHWEWRREASGLRAKRSKGWLWA